MTRAQREFTMGRFYPESPSIALENVDRTGMPDSMPRTWILTGLFTDAAVAAGAAAIATARTAVADNGPLTSRLAPLFDKVLCRR
jgi:hypothetical protein